MNKLTRASTSLYSFRETVSLSPDCTGETLEEPKLLVREAKIDANLYSVAGKCGL